MKMKDPLPTFSYLVSEIAKRHPDFAYIHVTEPRVAGGGVDRSEVTEGEVAIVFPYLYLPSNLSPREMRYFEKFGVPGHSLMQEGSPEISLWKQRKKTASWLPSVDTSSQM